VEVKYENDNMGYEEIEYVGKIEIPWGEITHLIRSFFNNLNPI
jgi:hypothetical protein